GRFDPLIRYELSEAFAGAVRESGGIALNKVYASHGHFSLIRRTTSWHLWPQPLLQDVLEFVEAHGKSVSKDEDPPSASSTKIAPPVEDP
ncbi:MAG: hypothetical protein VX969_04015, partial [Verrucomicrobiota bacterium]|nr:hypothetical protein [Verrucomicrobiota bacterium]